MSKLDHTTKATLRFFPAVLGLGLLAYVVLRTGPQLIWNQVQAVGLGLALIIALGGVSHLLKTWAWRLTFTCDITRLSWRHSFGMRLVSEAIGQLGLAGKIFGEGMRVSLLGPAVPIENSISAAALDSGLYTVSAAILTVSGLIATMLVASLSGRWRFFSMLFAAALVGTVVLIAVAIGRRWRLMGNAARVVGGVPVFRDWISRKQSVIDSTEHNLLNFHRKAPAAFWASLMLNFLCHALAVLEVYVILRFMGARSSMLGAFMLEAFTKLINLIGALNPGNVGTYEGGTMLITKLFGITGTVGLTLALCRRARAMFWAAIGALCLIVMKRPSAHNRTQFKADPPGPRGSQPTLKDEMAKGNRQSDNSRTVIILADCEQNGLPCSSLVRVGTLPVLLRAILNLRATQARRIIVCVPSAAARHIISELRHTRRLPLSVEWRQVGKDVNLAAHISEVAPTSDSVMLLLGDRTYQPQLLQSAAEWKGHGTLSLTTDGQLAGAYTLSQTAALDLARRSEVQIQSLSELHDWMQSDSSVEVKEVAAESWHRVVGPEDIREAERKLDGWLVKSTDGVFARMNRRVSIPISHQLIRFPITPNMVTLFTLAVSVASGLFFARGGYWNMLLGAALSVWASILDGCDGEVARLKLQSSKLGCWMDTICDYLYYLIIFIGIAVGLKNSSGSNAYFEWGAVLLAGAVLSFAVVSFLRRTMTQERPESFLAVWQKQAERRRSNPLLYVARNCEFIIRRCFFPYALLAFALLNLTRFAFIATAVGANLVWMIALYSRFALSSRTSSPHGEVRIPAPAPVKAVLISGPDAYVPGTD